MQKGIALVYPYFQERDPVQKLFPPLGLAFLSAQLQAMQLPATIYDCTFQTAPAVLASIARSQPALVGIYSMLTMSRPALELAEKIRSLLPGSLLVAGGPLPTLYPQRFCNPFHLALRGESDLIFPAFCREYLATGGHPDILPRLSWERYPGAYYPSPQGLIQSAPIHQPSSILDRLPLPDRNQFDHARYQQAWQESTGRKATSMIITRGCPFSCDFCSKPVWGSQFRKSSLERVYAELAAIKALDYDQVWIADDSFTLDLKYLRAFCQGKIERQLDLGWTCLSRVDNLDQPTVSLMKRAGCEKVYLGLESGSDRTLALMGKRATVRNGVEAVELFTSAGIKTAAFFIVGYPGESREDIERTFAYALSLRLDEISFNVPFPLPGSPLFSRLHGIDTDADWEVSKETTFVYPSEFDPSWIKKRIRHTLDRFDEQK